VVLHARVAKEVHSSLQPAHAPGVGIRRQQRRQISGVVQQLGHGRGLVGDRIGAVAPLLDETWADPSSWAQRSVDLAALAGEEI
jgi:hypothetical protein